ncbi:MAG: NAD-dependent epimerase/dehydratase family protein [Bacteroidetes bacterium]|nr:NAD-dependent epimerase/dehydratase family protein [Bacteroidota bacterium]
MILVTGGTGLVGAHLLLKLAQQGEKVKALVRTKDRIKEVEKIFSFYTENYQKLIDTIQWVEGDITDSSIVFELTKECEYVYHCAAYVSFNPKHKDKLYKTNINGTQNIVNGCLEHKIKKLIHVSSVAALGNPTQNNEVDEHCIWKSNKNNSHYAISKFVSEMEVWRGIEEGLNAVIVNPSYIIGPGDWKKSSAVIFAKAYKGIPAYTLGTTGYVDVRDVADCMVKLMNSPITAERFIVNSENISFKDFFTQCATSVGAKPPSIKLNKALLAIAWRLDALRLLFTRGIPYVTRQTATVALSEKKFSNKKISTVIGHKFISVADSINHAGKLYLQVKPN